MQKKNGFVGHMIFWESLLPRDKLDMLQGPPVWYQVRPHMSSLIQPPLVAQALLRIYKKTKDDELLTELLPKIKKYFGGSVKGKRFALWGLAFKPNTDDIREAPALDIIQALLADGASLCVYDPEAMNNVKNILGDKVMYAENQYDCLQSADALIIATEWNEFRTPNFLKIVTALKNKVIFDGRNLFETDAIRELGFYYESIGREIAIPTNGVAHK